jgi:hypothetical protein
MSFPCGSRQGTAFAQTAAASDGILVSSPLDGLL